MTPQTDPFSIPHEQRFHAYGTEMVHGRALALGTDTTSLQDGCGGALARHLLLDPASATAIPCPAACRERYETIERHLAAIRPERVYLPSPLEDAAFLRMARTACARLHHPCAFWLYEVHRPLRPNRLVDIDPVWPLLPGKKSEQALALASYRALCAEPSVRHAEAFFVLRHPEDDGCDLSSLMRHLLMEDGLRLPPARRPTSIVIRTRNRPHLLAEALASCLSQTQAPHEIVVVNDGGDDVDAVLAPFRDACPIRYEHLHRNVGRARAANIGWQAASGTHIVFLDDDDLLMPSHLEILSAAALAGDADIVYSGAEFRTLSRDAAGAETLLASMPILHPWNRERIWFENPIPFMSALVPKHCLESVGGIDTAFDTYEDWDLWIRLAAAFRFRHVPHMTSIYRHYPAAGCGSTFEQPIRAPLRQLLAKHAADIPAHAWESWLRDRGAQDELATARGFAADAQALRKMEMDAARIASGEAGDIRRVADWLRGMGGRVRRSLRLNGRSPRH